MPALYAAPEALLQKIEPHARALGVRIGVENVWNNFLLSPLEMARFLDELNSPYIKAYFDVGNVMYSGYPEHWIRILGKRIKKVHFKDYRRDAKGLAGFVDLLAGDVDWVKVIDAFEAVGYTGWASAEMCPTYRLYTDQMIYNASAAMDCILRRK